MVFINSSGGIQSQETWRNATPSSVLSGIYTYLVLFLETIWKDPRSVIERQSRGGSDDGGRRRNNFGGGTTGRGPPRPPGGGGGGQRQGPRVTGFSDLKKRSATQNTPISGGG
mmetsp:Transcript_920/g.1116  ORF Transcript_920/g.1116 Transcript_920/m.1116 type:complete len:113 (+) Transcript_920:183-521(+)